MEFVVLKLQLFLLIYNYYLEMKGGCGCSSVEQDSQESYGQQFRLRYRKQFSSWSKEEKNRRISQAKKERLISMVTKQNYRIKEAGRILGISYSTAKKIFTNFRQDLRAKKESDTGDESKHVACSYRQVPEIGCHPPTMVLIISSIAGQVQISQSHCKSIYKL